MFNLVGLAGPASSGKDASAKALLESGGWARVSFADPLKRALEALNPIVVVESEEPAVAKHWPDAMLLGEDVVTDLQDILVRMGWEEGKKIKEVRRLAQVFGTECCRETFGNDCWVKIARRSVVEHLESGLRVVMTDVRFPEEANMIHELGGIVVRVVRPGVMPLNTHASESGLAGYDKILYNDGTLEDLHKKVLAQYGPDAAKRLEAMAELTAMSQAMGFYGDCRSD